MGVKNYKPTSPARRYYSGSDFKELTKGKKPEKSLLEHQTRSGGRNTHGRITSRFRGGGHKQRYRIIDWRRAKIGIPANVASIEYDPNRTARIALLHYVDGEKSYILAPDGLNGATRSSRAATRTSSRATRCRCVTSRSARRSTTSRCARARGGSSSAPRAPAPL